MIPSPEFTTTPHSARVVLFSRCKGRGITRSQASSTAALSAGQLLTYLYYLQEALLFQVRLRKPFMQHVAGPLGSGCWPLASPADSPTQQASLAPLPLSNCFKVSGLLCTSVPD